MDININITDKRAQVLGSPVIVCGNTDFRIVFAFDEEWAAFPNRTARFVYIRDGQVKYIDQAFTGDQVNVPMLSNIKEVMVGVFAGELHTTTPARIPCELSILCGIGTPDELTPIQYDQIMALLNSNQTAINGLKEQMDDAQQNNLQMAQDLQQLQTADQNLSERIAQNQKDLQQLQTADQNLSERIAQNQKDISNLQGQTGGESAERVCITAKVGVDEQGKLTLTDVSHSVAAINTEIKNDKTVYMKLDLSAASSEGHMVYMPLVSTLESEKLVMFNAVVGDVGVATSVDAFGRIYEGAEEWAIGLTSLAVRDLTAANSDIEA